MCVAVATAVDDVHKPRLRIMMIAPSRRTRASSKQLAHRFGEEDGARVFVVRCSSAVATVTFVIKRRRHSAVGPLASFEIQTSSSQFSTKGSFQERNSEMTDEENQCRAYGNCLTLLLFFMEEKKDKSFGQPKWQFATAGTTTLPARSR